MTCDRCYRPSDRGEHGVGLCPYERRRAHYGVKPDTIIGGFWAENAWTQPRYFDSQQAYEKALDADGMMLAPRWTPGSTHLTNWAMTDPQTLENARILVSRPGARRTTDTAGHLETVQWTTRVLDETFTVRAERER